MGREETEQGGKVEEVLVVVVEALRVVTVEATLLLRRRVVDARCVVGVGVVGGGVLFAVVRREVEDAWSVVVAFAVVAFGVVA